MITAKINKYKCKKLTFRRDLDTESAISYFTEKDIFLVDNTKEFYDFQNKPLYKASKGYGKTGYVAKEGVEIIVKPNTRRKHPFNHKKNAGR